MSRVRLAEFTHVPEVSMLPQANHKMIVPLNDRVSGVPIGQDLTRSSGRPTS